MKLSRMIACVSTCGMVVVALLAACKVMGPVDPSAPNAPSTVQVSPQWVDCHDGWWCPPAYPQCPLPLSEREGRACEAAGDPTLVGKGRRGDAGAEDGGDSGR